MKLHVCVISVKLEGLSQLNLDKWHLWPCCAAVTCSP